MHGEATDNGVVLQEVIKQAGQRSQFAADGGPGQAPTFELGAPGKHMCPGNGAELIGAGDPDKTAEIFKVVLIGEPIEFEKKRTLKFSDLS
jgi:hypothetical protein